MKLLQTSIAGVAILESAVHEKSHRLSMHSFDQFAFNDAFKTAGLSVPQQLVQDSHFRLRKGELRGLRYQLPPHAQGALISVIGGAAHVVAVDVRCDSPTYGKSVGVDLDSSSQRSLWIPEGFAHGYLALEEDTHFFCKTTHGLHSASERSLRWNDPAIGVNWPQSVQISVSEQDAAAPLLEDCERYSGFLHGTTEWIDLRVIGDQRGSLVALEPGLNIPFAIKRVYYIYGTLPDVGRGYHAHRRLEQMAICVSGRCKMIIDDGVTRQEQLLDSASKALVIRNMIWREMHDFSDDCVLLVLASEYYDESDYIRDYDQFIREVNNGKE
ncbi:WxcM-like domain-containing protein [Pseudomonas baetica]|uniref:WxcM-like domain-containing protein n=1 Tax=Pseudomonas TaxID=286 RepID=UPI000BA2F6F5|nr:WxcM-like domain-containing protein [Pseudomonas baetica]MDR9862863.1 WxcM-like domain-containing protein [Pseudomonas baetica]